MKDTIYRDEAVEICERWRQRAKEHHDRDGWYMADILLRFMREMPSVDRPQGEWINHFDDLFPEDSTIECSICHEEQPLEIDDNYCPNCGARMKGASDD